MIPIGRRILKTVQRCIGRAKIIGYDLDFAMKLLEAPLQFDTASANNGRIFFSTDGAHPLWLGYAVDPCYFVWAMD